MIPNTYFFNPTCEPAIANGSAFYTAPARLRKFESDLGYLPAWLAGEKDQVLVQGTLDEDFSQKMRHLGFRLPEILSLKGALADPDWLVQEKGRLFPWGWSPALYQLFSEVLPSYSDNFKQSAIAAWQIDHKHLYSRLTSMAMLDGILQHEGSEWLPFPEEIPVVCTSLEQIDHQLNGGRNKVVKTPWSSSGRGLLLFPNVDTRKKNDEVLSGMLNQQGFVTVEPWFDKLVDLSYQFYVSEGKIHYKGRTFFETDRKGRYLRNLLTDCPETSPKVSDFLEEHNAEVVAILHEAITQSDYVRLYEGWIGVDALIYQTDQGFLKFQPVVEINGRFTMGAIALKLREHLAAGSHGFLQIFYSKSSNFQTFCLNREAEKPLRLLNHKIVTGFLPLTPPLPGHQFGAFVEVDEDEKMRR